LALDGRVKLAHQWAFAFALNSSLDCGVQFPGRAACTIGAGVGTGVGVGVRQGWGADVWAYVR